MAILAQKVKNTVLEKSNGVQCAADECNAGLGYYTK
jgi:hypothetical protein